jgi:molecular chaperone GrpE (heat shock protein)
MPRGVTDPAIMRARGRIAAAVAHKNDELKRQAERELAQAQAKRNRRKAQELLASADDLEAEVGSS